MHTRKQVSGKSLCREYMILETFQWNYVPCTWKADLWKNVYDYTRSHKEIAVVFELPTLKCRVGTFWQKWCLFQVNTAKHSLGAMPLCSRSALKGSWEFSKLETGP